jgi:RNA polymerase sigma factor (TIGR02999 family)
LTSARIEFALQLTKRRFQEDSLTAVNNFAEGDAMGSPEQSRRADTRPVSQLLRQSRNGDRAAFDELIPIVYEQLHRLAAHVFRAENPGHTLRTTALVHEAYLRLAGADVDWNDRMHFYAVAARVMRRILVDHAKGQAREKRGGAAERVSLEAGLDVGAQAPAQLLDLDQALTKLAARDQRKSEVIELLFFGGLTYDEAAEALHISPATLHRELQMAKAWLHNELKTAGGEAKS